jgi:hypothetical protein
VCVLHYLTYKRGANIQWDFDLSHHLNNSSKQAIRTLGV